MSEASKGKPKSEEVVRNRIGKKLSEETKRKMSESNMKLNSGQIKEVREKYYTGKYKQCELVKEYYVSASTINRIINNKYLISYA